MGLSSQIQVPISTNSMPHPETGPSMPAPNHVESLLGLSIFDPNDTSTTNPPPTSTLPPQTPYLPFTPTTNHNLLPIDSTPTEPYTNSFAPGTNSNIPNFWDPNSSIPVFGNQETIYGGGGGTAGGSGEDLSWDDWNAFIFDAGAGDVGGGGV